MQERRILGENIKLSLSKSSESINAASTTKTITVYYNDTILRNSGVTISNSYTSWITASYSSSTGKVTLSITANTDKSNGRTAYIYILYKGKSVTYSITQSKDTIKSSNTTYSCSLISKTNQTGYNQDTTPSVTKLCTYTLDKIPTTTYTYYSGETTSFTMSGTQIQLSLNWAHSNTEWYISGTSEATASQTQLFAGWSTISNISGGRSNMLIQESDPVGSYVKCQLTVRAYTSPYTEYYTDPNFYTITRTSDGATITYGS